MVKGSPAYIGDGNQPASVQLKVVSRDRDEVGIAGLVDTLGLKIQGRAQPISAPELRLDLEIVAIRSLAGITGGGMNWTLRRDSASLGGKIRGSPAAPRQDRLALAGRRGRGGHGPVR